MMPRTAFLLFSMLFCSISFLGAGTGAKTMTATRILGPPKIDGSGDDEAWTKAQWYGGFLQREPVEGAEPSEKTEIKVVYDNDAIYFFLMMYDSEPTKIVGRLARRDNEVEADFISLRIDSYHDYQTGAE